MPLATKNRGTESPTRPRMIAAAFECILDLGLYRATSNEIARRAGLTWGAIQRQFGTREGLMLAVFEDGWDRLLAAQRDAHIDGDTTEKRVRSLFRALASYYGTPEAFVDMQIALELRKDPSTSKTTLDTIRRRTRESEQLMPAVMRQVFPSDRFDPVVAHFLYYSIRDFHIGRHVESVTAPADTVKQRRAIQAKEEELLIRALAAAVDAA